MIDRSECARCGRSVLWASDEYVSWETIDGAEVCPSCVTGEEEQAFVDEFIQGLPDDGT